MKNKAVICIKCKTTSVQKQLQLIERISWIRVVSCFYFKLFICLPKLHHNMFLFISHKSPQIWMQIKLPWVSGLPYLSKHTYMHCLMRNYKLHEKLEMKSFLRSNFKTEKPYCFTPKTGSLAPLLP